MINLKLEKGDLLFEATYKGMTEKRYVTPEQATEIAELMLEWVCSKKKETKIIIAGSKYSEEE